MAGLDLSVRSAQSRFAIPQLGLQQTRTIKLFFTYLGLAIVLFVALLPVVWVISTSFKTEDQLRISYPIQWLPSPVHIQNYSDGWNSHPWLMFLRNTLIFAGFSTLGMVLSSIPVGYALARVKFRGRELVRMLNISLMLLPGQVTMVPTFLLFRELGWVGTFLPTIVPSFLATAAWEVFVLQQFFRSIPTEITDAARLDGANELDIITRIMVPLSKPILTVIIIFHFTFKWNDYLTAVIYLKDTAHMPLILGLQLFVGYQGHTQWGPLMAMATLTALPVVVLFFIAQRYISEAFLLTGVKG